MPILVGSVISELVALFWRCEMLKKLFQQTILVVLFCLLEYMNRILEHPFGLYDIRSLFSQYLKSHNFSTVENFRCCLLTYIIINFQRIDEFWETML